VLEKRYGKDYRSTKDRSFLVGEYGKLSQQRGYLKD
jgi:hypothetical protein